MSDAALNHFEFDAQSEPLVQAAIAKYPPGKQASAVMALLYFAQSQMGRMTGRSWVPRVAMDAVAKRLQMPPIRVYEVATFYTMYNLHPVGKYHLQVCTTTPCWLRGSDEVVAACKKISGIATFGETSADQLFTLTEVECLGGCVNAPLLQINDDYYEDLNGERAEKLLADLKAGGALPPPGSTAGRHGSEPEGGRTVLLQPSNQAE